MNHQSHMILSFKHFLEQCVIRLQETGKYAALVIYESGLRQLEGHVKACNTSHTFSAAIYAMFCLFQCTLQKQYIQATCT